MVNYKSTNRYEALIEKIFFDHWTDKVDEFEFNREELETAAPALGFKSVKNIGDVPYSFRYRKALPENILATQPKGLEWVIIGAGRAKYRFKLVKATRVIPRDDLVQIGIPDATPEIIRSYALDDEQALLAIVRYNRLIDIFLGLTTYSLQNHLRTTVKDIGQIEIDELYIGMDKTGCHYVIPVQAKAGKDQIGIVQTQQDIIFATQKFPGMRCRAVSAQFMAGGVIALFELKVQNDEIRIAQERHYKLVPSSEMDRSAIIQYQD
ncbi:hypothetical protein [Thalassospira sp. ER-Se-21-Dark]|uniref:hypothetical protein n=1 Tax=Thalassospira sp. ER-Se-21-Dark TaxID=2585190 RepID=UPI001B30B411|nr:hypothetical protein [Thalassospira sp. ER-Se-21-Dark]MBP3124848.1 endonuclease [Thalassospira sp. ER-Se-21-Dark]